jgi:hypothetical protein
MPDVVVVGWLAPHTCRNSPVPARATAQRNLPGWHGQRRDQHRRERSRSARLGTPDTHRRDPLDDPLVVLLCGAQLGFPDLIGETVAQQEPRHNWRDLILALEAGLNGSRNGSRRPA